jgi:hypothetical protein
MITTNVIYVKWCLTRYPIKNSVTDAIHARVVSYSTHDYPYLHPKISIFLFVSKVFVFEFE